MSACVKKEEENSVLLEDLPTEVLLLIFKYCTLKSLGNVCQTCKRFNSVISDFFWDGRSRTVIATNQISADIQNRSSHLLSGSNKCRIACNWLRGRYTEKIYYPFKSRHLPWLVLESERLWMSKGKHIQAFQRKPNGLAKSPIACLRGNEEDVCRFVSVGGMIVSGGRDGSVCGWLIQSGHLQFRHPQSHQADILAVDMSENTIVSGSHDKTIKIWSISEHGLVCPELSIDVGDRVWSLAIRSQGDVCCVGSAGFYQVPPLQLYDVDRGHEVVKLQQCNVRNGAGVLDIHWESPHEILTGGYDTYLRLWDMRTGRNELMWEDPYDCAIYSIASDNTFTILCGMALHGRVHLWDKRHRKNIGKYFMSSRQSSPVFSLAFDPCKLFAVLDQSLHILDFSIFKEKCVGLTER